jgi:hypothetical protein
MRKQWQIALPPRAHYAPVGLQKLLRLRDL